MSDNFDEFEQQFEGVEDPSPFRTQHDVPNNGRALFELLHPVVDLVTDDLVKALDLGGLGLSQYLRQDGVSVTTMISADGRKLGIQIQLPADHPPLIKIIDDEEPEVYDPDKDNGF